MYYLNHVHADRKTVCETPRVYSTTKVWIEKVRVSEVREEVAKSSSKNKKSYSQPRGRPPVHALVLALVNALIHAVRSTELRVGQAASQTGMVMMINMCRKECR